MLDQPGIGSDPASGALAEYMIQTNHGYSAAVDDVL